MHPYGSGMPHGGAPYPPANNSSVPFGAGRWAPPGSNPYPAHQEQTQNPSAPPFGAGRWVQPNQSPYPTSQPSPYPSSNPYPPQTAQAPYPTHSPYGQPAPYQSSTPYPPQGASASPYPPQNTAASPYPPQNTSASPYPPSQGAYPPTSSPYHTSQPAPYPGTGTSAPYPGGAYYSSQQQSAYSASSVGSSYPPQSHDNNHYAHAGQQNTTHPSGSRYNSAAANSMAQCFKEMKSSGPILNNQPPKKVTASQAPNHQQSNLIKWIQFFEMKQKPDESVNSWIERVKSSATSCDFEIPLVKIKFLTGMQKGPILDRMCQEDSSMSLNEFLSLAVQMEKNLRVYRTPPRKIKENRKCYQGNPTVFAAADFDPVKDAHALRKAMRGFGTDEDTLINIICRRSNLQRQEIQRQYKTHFGKDLIEDIKSETSGNFERLLVGLLLPIVNFYVKELNDAMEGIGTDEDVLIEVLCTLSNQEIYIIKTTYERTYGRPLEAELMSETSGNFKRLLVSLCCAARDESGVVDPVAAQQDARDLLNAGELRFGTDESTFNRILCQRNFQHLQMVFTEYANITGHTLDKAIKREFSGDIEEGLLSIYQIVTNKAEFFARRLHKSMAGLGTNDSQLIRLVITRCEIDMADIKQAFEGLYGKSLKSWIKGDTSGHYKHALYALIGEERSG